MSDEVKPTLSELMAAYDWKHIMSEYANPKFDFSDIEEVVLIEEGDNDGPDWVGVFKLNNGSFGVVRAGCDYTGWGCQESGGSDLYETKDIALSRVVDAEMKAYSARSSLMQKCRDLMDNGYQAE
jgi:hypothetical protein